ncbi:PAS domain S-box protein [Ktedonobacter racemifer]|uniref:histidine kinase n=1 Tax=Ktedonobacter racemifer DSM 44963 TaxID=485913 RepID=D6TE94_KTERA|nr:PAS domain S-box protein [Ktedonobacter racemifer]EFH88467.1 PAS/PAC sensor signal transduction histidine kinase [Ktedonobacter racemifer DSM 44963]
MSNAKQTKRLTPGSRETLLTILETLPDAFFVVDDAGTIVYANASAQAMSGATPEDVCGKSLWCGASHLVSTALYQVIQKAKQTQEPTEVEYASPVTRHWLHVQLAPTVGGLMLQFHEMRAPAPRQETFPRGERLCIGDLDGLPTWIGILTPEGIVLDINAVPLDDAQVRREEVIGKPLAEAPWWSFAPASQEWLRAAIARASTGETVHFEVLLRPRGGIVLSFEGTITPHMDADHHVEYLVIAGIDITARKQADEAIHTLIDAIPQLVWIARPDGSITYNNQRLIDYLAMTLEQVEGAGWLAGVHSDDRHRVWEAWQTAIQTGVPYEVEQRLQDGTSGAYRWFLVRGVPQRNAQGTILHWVGTCTDIDEQKRVEQQLNESRENWRVLAETVPQLVWTSLPDGFVTYFNQRSFEYTHAAFEQLQGYGWYQFVHPEDAERLVALRRHAFATGETYEVANRVRNGQTGAYRWFLTRAMPVRDGIGQIVKWVGTCTDIEDQKQAEQKLKESRENFRVLAETLPHLVWTMQPDGRLDYVNQRACDYIGASPEYMLGDEWWQFVHPDDYERIQALRRHSRETGEPYEIEYRLKDGQTGAYRWFLGRTLPVRDDTGQIIKWLGTSTDIEGQKRIEESLRQSQERVSVLMNSTMIGINIIEKEQIVDANDTFLRMTGYTCEDLRAGRMNWMRMTPPEYLARTRQVHQELATQQSVTYEKEYICKDGSRLPVVVCGVVLKHHPRQAIAFVLDNSARKELDQRKDAFISMASHELRNPLTALKLQTSLLHRQLARQGIPASAPALSSMETQINTVTRLVEEWLDVSKFQAGRLEYVRERVNLDELLREIVDTMQQTHPSHRILLRGAVQTSLMADRDRLGQVFTNLLSNAIKYSPGAETVEMDLSTSEETVTVRVCDHGLGIPREQRDKIFERFYRASGPRQKAIPGLGMGLYIVAEIVKRHRGTITVDSTVGKGSTFTVTLPKKRDA